jgi:hypothetical protein
MSFLAIFDNSLFLLSILAFFSILKK